mgnify:CR=1 FL=1|jgi:hypothetical protein
MTYLDITARGCLIKTRYLGPTNHRGSRVVATHKWCDSETKRATVSWDYELDAQDNHLAAAQQLAAVMFSLPSSSVPGKISGMGWDHDAYYFLALADWA